MLAHVLILSNMKPRAHSGSWTFGSPDSQKVSITSWRTYFLALASARHQNASKLYRALQLLLLLSPKLFPISFCQHFPLANPRRKLKILACSWEVLGWNGAGRGSGRDSWPSWLILSTPFPQVWAFTLLCRRLGWGREMDRKVRGNHCWQEEPARQQSD